MPLTTRRARGLVLTLLLVLLGTSGAWAQNTTDMTTGLTPTDLANALVGPGITINDARLTGAPEAAGLFDTAAFLLTFDDGVLLSTGTIANVRGPNARDNMSTNFRLAGDPDFTALAGTATFDAVFLEIDIVPLGDQIEIRYVFGSDEYNEFVYEDSNDAMGLFVNGVNCALINDEAVSIDTINGGNPLGTRASNAGLYNNNDRTDGGPFVNSEMDGYTDTLTCSAAVNPGVVNTLKLGLADAADGVWDSWLFLEGQSITALPPSLGVAKNATTSGRRVTLDFYLENVSTFDLTDVSLTDDLDATFGAGNYTIVTPPAIVSDPGGGLALNGAYDGAADIEMLALGSALAAGDTAQIQLVVDVNSSGNFLNFATGQGDPPTGPADRTTDLSQDGTAVDPDADGDPGNNSDQTPITTEFPILALAKDATVTGSGPYTVTLDFYLENLGDVDLNEVQIVDNLDTTFGAGNYVIVIPPAIVSDPGGGLVPNAAFDGSADQNLLAAGSTLAFAAPNNVAQVQVVLSLSVTGQFVNRATASASAPAGTQVQDDSQNGTDGDPDSNGDPSDNSDPTPINLETPVLGLAKTAVVTGTNPYTARIEFVLQNYGDVGLTVVQLADDLDTTFGAGNYSIVTPPAIVSDPGGGLVLNPGFDGSGDPQLLDPASTLATGAGIDTATISFEVQVNTAGAYTNTALATANSPASVVVSDDSQNGADPDPDANGDPSDNSDPTPIFLENPSIGVAKQATTTGTGPYQVVIDFALENFGDVPLDDVQIVDDFDAAFGAGNYNILATPSIVSDPGGALVPNPGFNGSSDQNLLAAGSVLRNLPPDNVAVVRVEVQVIAPGRYYNRATASGQSAGGTLVTDESVDGADPDPDDNADPTDNTSPTPIPPEEPMIGLAKNATVFGTGPYRVTLDFYLENSGQSDLSDVQIADNLDATFGAGNYSIGVAPVIVSDPGGGLAANAAFDGSSDQNLLAPGSTLAFGPPNNVAQVQVVVLLSTSGDYFNSAQASGLPPSGLENGVSDASQLGVDPDPDANGDPTDNNEPTPINLGQGLMVQMLVESAKREASVGDFVPFTVTATNVSTTDFADLEISNDLPPGFDLVDTTATLTRPGPDAQFGTPDDVTGPIVPTGSGPLSFAPLPLSAGEQLRIAYLTRVGATALQGEQFNRARPFAFAFPVGNLGTAPILVTQDPALQQSLIIGKVFNDRDGDGIQDTARATNIVLRRSGGSPIVEGELTIDRGQGAEPFESRRGSLAQGLKLGDLDGRRNAGDPATSHRIVLRAPIQGEQLGTLELTTREGLSSTIAADGQRTDDTDDNDRGTNNQQLVVRQWVDTESEPASLVIEISNHGLEEAGIPGVRLATVTGLLIETDQHGKFHIADVDAGRFDRGRNFILKVDPATLPAGHEFTTRNPRVIRLTQGAMTKINFGVKLADNSLPHATVRAPLGDIYFQPGTSTISNDSDKQLDLIAGALRQYHCGDLTIESRAEMASLKQDALAVAYARADAIRTRLIKLLEAPSALAGPICIESRQLVSAEGPWGFEKEGVGAEHMLCPSPAAALAASQLTGGVFAEMPPGANGKPTNETIHAGTISLRDGSPDSGGDNPWQVESDEYATWSFVEPICQGRAGYALEVIGRETMPAAMPASIGSARDQSDRSATVTGTFRVRLPNGGVVWATEDPAVVEPKLNISAPARIHVANSAMVEPVAFTIYTNYRWFIHRWQIDVYRASDTDRAWPLATTSGAVFEFAEPILWAGEGLATTLEHGEKLAYVLRVFDRDGHMDETFPGLMEIYSDDGTRLTPGATAPVQSADAEPAEEKDEWDDAQYEMSDLPGLLWDDESNAGPASGGNVSFGGAADDARVGDEPGVESPGEPEDDTPPKFYFTFEDEPLTEEEPADADAEASADPDLDASTDAGSSGVSVQRVALEIDESADSSSNEWILASNDSDRADSFGTKTSGKKQQDSGTGPKTGDQPAAQAYATSGLRLRGIPVRGSRVRLHGAELGEGFALQVGGREVPADRNGRFAYEQILPIGQHQIEVAVEERSGRPWKRKIPVDVTGKHFFMVGIADVTAGSNSQVLVEPLSQDENYDGDVFVDGRVAFYLKGKVKGKYLITAQADTTEDDIGEIFGDLDEEDPRRVFRNLDPDRYYPVYGDDSTTIDDTDSQGRFYVRVDWDHNRALWGNYNTGITGTEFGQYNRSLYGGQFQHRSADSTEYGEPQTQVNAFASQSRSAFGHDEFRSTGGSLFYLRHREIVQGSEKVWVEVRDRDTERVLEVRTLFRGRDYEVDDLQGRIVLARPLPLTAQTVAPALIDDQPLDGNGVFLLVDYEYLTAGMSTDEWTYGTRAKHWFGGKIGLGATYVDENRTQENHTLTEADLTLRLTRGTFLKTEWAQTEATQAMDARFSADGGLTFSPLSAPALPGPRTGDALSVEARVNLLELTDATDAQIAAWFRQRDAGFSVARADTGVEIEETGVEALWKVNGNLSLAARAGMVDRIGIEERQKISLQGDYELTDVWKVAAEVRTLKVEDPSTVIEDALLAAFKVERRLSERFATYLLAQFSLDSGPLGDNNRQAVGVRAKLTDKLGAHLEVGTGDRGDSLVAGLSMRTGDVTVHVDGSMGGVGEAVRAGSEVQISENHSVYGTYTLSTDRTDGRRGISTIGQRLQLSNQTQVFVENQFSRSDTQAGITHVYGVDFAPLKQWKVGISMQKSTIDHATLANIDRRAFSGWTSFGGPRIDAYSKVELREDEGPSTNASQWLTTTRADLKIGRSLTALAKINMSRTEDDITSTNSARFTESSLGLALRPTANDRLNLIAKYTFLYDLPSLAQVPLRNDERSHVVTLDTVYDVTKRWSVGGKVGRKVAELRTSRDSGAWFENTVQLATVRVRYHLVQGWDGLLDYRWLSVDETNDDRHGALIGVSRLLGKHLELGVGYNFSGVSDDLTNLDESSNGWFVNVVAKH